MRIRSPGHQTWGSRAPDQSTNDPGVVGVTVVLDGRVSFDLVETEQLPETIGDSDCRTAQRVAWATTGLDGRNNLNAIQPIVTANGRSGWAVEKLAGRAYFIIGRD